MLSLESLFTNLLNNLFKICMKDFKQEQTLTGDFDRSPKRTSSSKLVMMHTPGKTNAKTGLNSGP